MNTSPFIDLTAYGRPVRLSVTTGITLPTRLLKAAPAQPSARVHAALTAIRDRAEQLQARLIAQQRRHNLRPFDAEFDGAWAGLYGRIQSHTRVIANPRRAEAQALLATLFPDGLEWLKAGYEAEWIYAKTLLERIKTDGHGEALEILAGTVFVTWAREATDKLGNALGVGEQEAAKVPSLRPILTAIAHAIANYGRIHAGEIDLDDEDQLAAFRAAMAPIDEHRRRGRRSARSDDSDAGDDAEVELFDEDEVLDDLEAPLPELPVLD